MKKKILLFIITMFFAFPVYAEECLKESLLNVNGSGKIKVQPDIAELTIGLSSDAKTASDAISKNSILMKKLFTIIHNFNILDKDIRSANVSVNPMYKPDKTYNQLENNIIGYKANNQVTVKVRKINDLGKIIDSCLQEGNFTINGLNFSLEDTTKYELDALKKAVSSAKEKAAAIVESAGIKLLGIKTINVDLQSYPVYKEFYAARAYATVDSASSTPPPIEAGEIEINQNVSVSFLIGQ